jgi:thiamine pyrophosphate-dependent acetolactate synthase large subunit-like protein
LPLEARLAAPRVAPSAAHAIFEVLSDWGVEYVFTCPGSTEAAVLDASLDYAGINLVLVTHESIAVAAADAYARISGKIAVAYLHANVGLANGVAHLSCASLSRTPLVVLNGIKSTVIANRGGFTTAPHMTDHVRQYTQYAKVALRADEIAGDLTRALQAATADPGGPVYLGLPQDLVEARAPFALPNAKRRRVISRRRPDPAAIALAARTLTDGRAVTIVAGSELAYPPARGTLIELADRLSAPILLEDRRTISSNGILGDTPAYAGTYNPAHPAIAASDVVLFAGMRSFVEFEPPKAPNIPRDATIIHICSDPTEIAKVDEVDIGITANAVLALNDLIAAIGDVTSIQRRQHLQNAVAAQRARVAHRRATLRSRFAEKPIHPAVLMEALHDLLPDDCILMNDAVTSGGYLLDSLLPGTAREMHTVTGGSLGWAMGAAIGAQLARPDARIVCIVGDGAFQFGIQSLHTANSLRLPIVHIVVDNASYAAVKAALKRYRERSDTSQATFPASDIAGPKIATIARGFGANAETVESLADLPLAIERAMCIDGPSVVVVKTDRSHTGP